MANAWRTAALAMAVAALVACGKSDDGTSDGDQAIADSKSLIDKICASTCSTRQCIGELNNELNAHSDQLESVVGSPAQEKQIVDMLPRAHKCMKKATWRALAEEQKGSNRAAEIGDVELIVVFEKDVDEGAARAVLAATGRPYRSGSDSSKGKQYFYAHGPQFTINAIDDAAGSALAQKLQASPEVYEVYEADWTVSKS